MDNEPRFHGDVTEQRHNIMSKIKGKDTKPEIVLRKYLWSKGLHYRKNYKKLPGKPDIVLTKYKVAVFVDSEFFHGKDWEVQKQKVRKGSNADYWVKKIERNIERDKLKDQALKDLGWSIIHFWSKDVEKNVDQCYLQIVNSIDERGEFDDQAEE